MKIVMKFRSLIFLLTNIIDTRDIYQLVETPFAYIAKIGNKKKIRSYLFRQER